MTDLVPSTGPDARTIGGRYRLGRRLGEGGHGVVYEARDLEDGRRVAIKILRPERVGGGFVRKRFLREGEVLCQLRHPHIATAYAVDGTSSEAFIAMEWVDGATLQDELVRRATERRPFTFVEAIDIVSQIAGAIEYAHELGLVHRDLKPTNVMLSNEGQVKVLDFGVVKLVNLPIDHQTTVGRIIGTIDYLSPEQAQGLAVDRRADVFALATILFEILTLRSPWIQDLDGQPVDFCEDESLPPNNDVPQVLGRIIRGPRPSARRIRPEIPAAADEILARGFAPRADLRPRSAVSFVADLADALGVRRAPPRTSFVSSRAWWTIAATFVVMFAATIVTVAVWPRPAVEWLIVPGAVVQPGARAITTTVTKAPVESPEPRAPVSRAVPRRSSVRETSLARALRRARSRPDDPRRLAALREVVLDESRSLDPDRRQRIERCVLSASLVGRFAELAACARGLEPTP